MSVSSIVGANGLVPVQTTAATTQVHLGQSAQWRLPITAANPGVTKQYNTALSWTLTPSAQFPDFYQGVMDISGSLGVSVSNAATTVGFAVSDQSNAGPSPNLLYTTDISLGALNAVGVINGSSNQFRVPLSNSFPYAFTTFPAGQTQKLYLNFWTSAPTQGNGTAVTNATGLTYTNTLTPSTLITDVIGVIP
jgi:hypothetical protein